MLDSLLPITQAQDIADIKALIVPFVECDHLFSVDARSKLGWDIVPVESSAHFAPEDIKRIVAAGASIGIREAFAVATETLEDHDSCYRLALTYEGLNRFNEVSAPFSFVVYPKELTFGILCSVEDYYLIGGMRGFLEVALGETVEDAKSTFADYAMDTSWDTHRQRFLKSVHDKYAEG